MDKKEKQENPEAPNEEAEEYIVKYDSENHSKTQQGNIYNINISIGQPSPPPYHPKP
jgi:hypothetical protein